MMRVYRALSEIKAITFDLDDTLYDNSPVMQRTEEHVLAFLQQHYPACSKMSISDFKQLRMKIREQEPEIYHDVSYWRWRSLEWFLLEQGYGADKARQGATEAMAQFAHWRSQIIVSDSVHETLQALSKGFELAVITNGNANPELFGIAHYFKFVLRAGPNGRAKPYHDMYLEAAQRLNLPLSQILHVGDHLLTDVAGAIAAGAQACWINDVDRNLMTESTSRILPHIEISRLDSLKALL